MKVFLIFFTCCFITLASFSQETFPVYTDYLSDNVFLIHPSAAGIGDCGKLRLTYRQQWVGVEDAPSLQTLSFHRKITPKAAVGAIIFNDENGFHSQKGFSGAYAYHLNFGREQALNQLSFGLSFMYVQNSVDQRSFISPIPDPEISQIIESSNYYNADFSLAYHYMDMFSYFTVKNLLLSSRDLVNSNFESANLRRYLLTYGYYLGRQNSFQLEPSIMGQFIERTGEIFVDFNVKAYKKVNKTTMIWAALSYRQNFENNDIEALKQLTPIIGINVKRFLFSYTYTTQFDDIVIDNGGNHQFTLGFDLFCKKPRATGCPNVTSQY